MTSNTKYQSLLYKKSNLADDGKCVQCEERNPRGKTSEYLSLTTCQRFEKKADKSFPMNKDEPKKDGSASGDNSKKEDAKKTPLNDDKSMKIERKPPTLLKGGLLDRSPVSWIRILGGWHFSFSCRFSL